MNVKRGTVLIVEDDQDIREAITILLGREGYRALAAKTGAEALEKTAQKPDMIILDVMLPDGTGFDFLEELRRNNVEIPVIFLTAVGDEANIVRGLDLGADDYVTKPYRVKELLSRISAILRREERIRRMAAMSAAAGSVVSDTDSGCRGLC